MLTSFVYMKSGLRLGWNTCRYICLSPVLCPASLSCTFCIACVFSSLVVIWSSMLRYLCMHLSGLSVFSSLSMRFICTYVPIGSSLYFLSTRSCSLAYLSPVILAHPGSVSTSLYLVMLLYTSASSLSICTWS